MSDSLLNRVEVEPNDGESSTTPAPEPSPPFADKDGPEDGGTKEGDGGNTESSIEGDNSGSHNEDDGDEVPTSFFEAGQVFLSNETAAFIVELPPSEWITGVPVVVPGEVDVEEVVRLSFVREPGADDANVVNWTSTLGPNAFNSEHYGKKMFTVTEIERDGGITREFAFGVFSILSIINATDRADLESQLKSEIGKESESDLDGGLSNGDSLWEVGYGADDSHTSTPKPGDGDPDVLDLSDGAKAGIGVGVSVGVLAIIGLAIFFFLRRRRRATTNAKSLPVTNDYMGDKETHAARVAESPASDDARDSTAFVAAEPPAGRGSIVATPTSMSREVPHSVAHLVEEGMTEEQIRRLEDEERALDQAIEQAGRR